MTKWALSSVSRSKPSKLILSAFSIASACAGPLRAEPDIINPPFSDVQKAQEKSDFGFRNGSVIVAPVPFSNPAIGSGLAIGGGYLFKTDPDANTSLIGLGAARSDNGSEAIGLAFNIARPEGKVSYNATLAFADVNYDLFVSSREVPIQQEGTLFQGSATYGLTDAWSFGATFRYLDTKVSSGRESTPLPTEILPDINLELASVGASVEWDTRDDSDYPTQGLRFQLAANRAATVNGPERRYSYGNATLDGYYSFGETSVIAGRLATCAADDDAPFFDSCSIGFSDAFRGFSPTQFIDTRMASLQAEVRQRLGSRLGVVAFGGLGWTNDTYDGLFDTDERSAYGLGIRFRISRQFPMDFSIDVSRNDEAEDNVYIYVGQRF